MTEPTPDLIRAVRAGCRATFPAPLMLYHEISECDYPQCDCDWRPKFLRAALAEIAEPSVAMLGVASRLNHPTDAEIWCAMMRAVLGDEP